MTNPVPVNGAQAGPASQLRRDDRQRDIIDHAVAVQASCNTVAAIEYLKSNDVAPALIERVLLEPARRRPLARGAAS